VWDGEQCAQVCHKSFLRMDGFHVKNICY